MTVVIVVLVVVLVAAAAFAVSRRRPREPADLAPGDPGVAGGRVADPHHGEIGGRGAGPIGP